ncbi:MAG: DUF2797 domain-containing protein [Gammaproteobacteria bacterium]|nr:DUF2797 domain-containing protein [Gammaproteobacteria bacterium]
MNTKARGIVRKMVTRLEQPVTYQLRLGENRVTMNPLLEQSVVLEYSGNIFCINCGRKTDKSFNQGYCYPCFRRLARCDSCILHPEQCHFDQGTCREPVWGERHCLQDHIIYLANTSALKVGITRASQVPTRWIDQGATQALAIIRVRNRLQSGVLEVMFKRHVSDKTNWRNMLKGEPDKIDLITERDNLTELCYEEIADLREQFDFFAISMIKGIDPVNIRYPVKVYPEKITSFNFDKNSRIEGMLLGIKGQYLIFDSGVINIRRFSGYEVELRC